MEVYKDWKPKRYTKYKKDLELIESLDIGDSVILNSGPKEKERLRIKVQRHFTDRKISFYKCGESSYRIFRRS